MGFKPKLDTHKLGFGKRAMTAPVAKPTSLQRLKAIADHVLSWTRSKVKPTAAYKGGRKKADGKRR